MVPTFSVLCYLYFILELCTQQYVNEGKTKQFLPV